MDYPKQTEAIKRFLQANTHSDLANLYNESMEVQVLVAQDNGQRVESEYKGKRYHSYSDGVQTWRSIRIPYNANSEPEYDLDKPMSYDLSEHAEGVGLTGWNWRERKSYWLGFDFDALVGHSTKHTKRLTEQQLQNIIDTVHNVPYITIRKSTSGKGLHLYLFLSEGFPTANHSLHAALARSLLGQLSAELNFDLSAKADAQGGILWVWHRKMKNTDGLTLIKQGTAFDVSKIPPNYMEHLPVILGKRNKSVPIQVEEDATQDIFDLVSGQRSKIPLDKEHKRLIDFLNNLNYKSYFDAERWMLVSHVGALKEAHKELGLRGHYDTISESTDPNSQNCFCFPLGNGGWVIRRFTPGVAEANTWEQDAQGYTKCYFNCQPNLYSSSRAHGGLESKNKYFVFKEAEEAAKAVKELGINLDLPEKMKDRKARIKSILNTNKLLIEIEAEPNKDSALELDDWHQEGKYWQRIINYRGIANNQQHESEIYNYDDTIRHIISEDGKDLGWTIKSGDNNIFWHSEPLQHVKTILEGSYGHSLKESKTVLGNNIIKPWIIVNRPFQSEYPGDRIWNQNSAQFRFTPSTEDVLSYPTWLKIFKHLGKSLDHECKNSEYCRKNNILTGADYLLLWVSSLFQNPYEPLPYLFFYGEENIGKSMFHESLALLITSGYVRCDSALKSSSSFNGELAGAILCVIEETDLKKDKIAAAKIKDWVTAQMLPIHAKGRTPYLIPNTCHFVQCVPKDTWTLTSKGPKQVKDLINQEFITIVNGLKYKTNGFFHTGYKEVFEIETIEGHTLQATDNHKILTQYFDEIVMWQEVKNLKVGDKLCLNNHSNIQWNGEGDFDEGYVLGWLIGDGSFRKEPIDPVLYFFTDGDKSIINYITNTLNKCNLLERFDGTLTIAGKQLKDLCIHFGLHNKNISNLENTSYDFHCGFLSGFFDSDATVNVTNKALTLYQSDYNRLQIVQKMLLRLGITSKIYKARDSVVKIIMKNNFETTSKISYQLDIRNKQNLQRFKDKVDFRIKEKNDNLIIILNSWTRKSIVTDFITRIKSIKSIGFKDVYDITVPQADMFDANGFIVHNCSNDYNALPIFAGDSRITMIKVEKFDKSSGEEEIPKRVMLNLLTKEAPDFLASILQIELPNPQGRLNIPILSTQDKKILQKSNQTPIEEFLENSVYYAPGKAILYSELFDKFKQNLDSQELIFWTIRTFGKHLPPTFPKGRLHGVNPNWFIGNISFDPPTEEELKQRKYILVGQYLILEDK